MSSNDIHYKKRICSIHFSSDCYSPGTKVLNFNAVPSLNLSNYYYYYLIIIIQKMLLCYFVSLVLINDISTTDTNDSPSIEGVTETINCSVNSVGK